jgi:hypothetical protein
MRAVQSAKKKPLRKRLKIIVGDICGVISMPVLPTLSLSQRM